MRFKDFGETEKISMSDESVSVSSTVLDESEEIRLLEFSNKTYLSPWRIPMSMDTSNSKIFTVRYEGKIVGQVLLFNFQTNDGLKSCSISYWISQEYASKGITSRAVQLVIECAFSKFNVHEVDATIQPENAPSIKVIEKLKFKHRDMIGEGRVIDGRWQNYTLYTVVRDLKDVDG